MRLRPVPSVLALSFFGAVLACSGGDATIGDPGADGGALPSDASEPKAPDGSGSGTLDADAPDASGPDASSDRRIDPIALGRSWTYDVTILGVYPICKAGSHKGQVLGQKTVGGKEAFQVQSLCPAAGTSSYAVDGDRVEIYYGGAWVIALDTPVEEGHTWTNGVETFIWKEVGKETVPAGTFDECWRAASQTTPSFTTFCRGIGPVHWHYVDLVGNGYDAKLTAFER